MIKPRFRARAFHSLISCLLLAACASLPTACSFKEYDDPATPRKTRTRTLPGKDAPASSAARPAEAQTAFAQALALWKKDGASASPGEVCADPEKAVALLNKAIALDPGYGEAYIRRGLARSDMGEHEQAFEDLTAGIRFSPTPEAYAHRALVLLRNGESKAAKRDLEYSLAQEPSQHLAHNYTGVLALAENNTTLACRSFREGCSQGDCTFLESARKQKLCP